MKVLFLSSMPGPHLPFQTGIGVPPPLPPRQPVQSYLGYNDYRPYSSSYGTYGYGGSYRGYGGYGSFGSYIPYSNNSYGQIGGHSGDVENRYFRSINTYLRVDYWNTYKMIKEEKHNLELSWLIFCLRNIIIQS